MWLDIFSSSQFTINTEIYSEWGAIQLLIDFGAIPVWIKEKVSVSNDIRQFLKSNEILRRCEGVGRLLLRQPGESIIMNSEGNASAGNSQTKVRNRNQLKKSDYVSFLVETDSRELENAEALMPPEMYVPNQEKWLELRLNQQKSSLAICC